MSEGIEIADNKMSKEEVGACSAAQYGRRLVREALMRQFPDLLVPLGIDPEIDDFSEPLCVYQEVHGRLMERLEKTMEAGYEEDESAFERFDQMAMRLIPLLVPNDRRDFVVYILDEWKRLKKSEDGRDFGLSVLAWIAPTCFTEKGLEDLRDKVLALCEEVLSGEEMIGIPQVWAVAVLQAIRLNNDGPMIEPKYLAKTHKLLQEVTRRPVSNEGEEALVAIKAIENQMISRGMLCPFAGTSRLWDQ